MTVFNRLQLFFYVLIWNLKKKFIDFIGQSVYAFVRVLQPIQKLIQNADHDQIIKLIEHIGFELIISSATIWKNF